MTARPAKKDRQFFMNASQKGHHIDMESRFIESSRDDRANDPPAIHRVEHRVDGQATVVARTSDVYARQQELSLRAAEFIAADATGELVLIEEATDSVVARRSLWPEPAGSAPTHHAGGRQHDTSGWLGGKSRPAPSWSPSPLPHQHRFADVMSRRHASLDASLSDGD